MREPTQSYNHKIKVLLLSSPIAKNTQQLPVSPFSLPPPSLSSVSFYLVSSTFSYISYFENETENIKPEKLRIEHFHVCFSFYSLCDSGIVYVCLVMRGYRWHLTTSAKLFLCKVRQTFEQTS